MCRSIKVLRPHEAHPAGATPVEIEEAALQYVRKVSGYRVPSKANQQAFDRAVAEIAHATHHLLEDLHVGRAVAVAS
ncbi:MAG: DUF2277 domain-containing protein [Candidatus Dormibacteraceae bacterium]